MADEYISKQAFNDAIREAVRKYPNTFYNGLEVARKIAHDMDAADVQPVRKGRWMYLYDENYRCSECGEDFALIDGTDFLGLLNYCPNCGARMDGGVDA